MDLYDVIVIGAGPAGAYAALKADQLGLCVLLIDEQQNAGGQVWRPKSTSILKAPENDASIKGEKLRTELQSSKIEIKYDTRVWHIEQHDKDEWQLGIVEKTQGKIVFGQNLVIATGAQERIIPFPGWTTPGVLGLAASTAIFKEHMIVSGNKSVVAGCGPLLFFVASEIERLGGTVEAVVSLNSKMDWLKTLPEMIKKPALLWQGLKWIVGLLKNGTPIYWHYGVESVAGEEAIRFVSIKKVKEDWSFENSPAIEINADGLFIGHGLMPAIEATRLASANHHYDPALGGWVVTVNDKGETSIPTLYACGDNAGVLGVLAAPHRGKLVAMKIAAKLNKNLPNDFEKQRSKELLSFRSAIDFGITATALTIPRSGMETWMTDQTEICRCEGLTRIEVEREIENGAATPNAVKSGSRCGMGPCGGRFCQESLAILTGSLTGKTRDEIGLSTARSPLRPVAISDIAPDLDYEDLPIPGVSPL